jgi:hypothetical protein
VYKKKIKWRLLKEKLAVKQRIKKEGRNIRNECMRLDFPQPTWPQAWCGLHAVSPSLLSLIPFKKNLPFFLFLCYNFLYHSLLSSQTHMHR